MAMIMLELAILYHYLTKYMWEAILGNFAMKAQIKFQMETRYQCYIEENNEGL